MKCDKLSASLKLPELKFKKFLITEPDDKGFAKDQYNKIINRIINQQKLQLKPWEKELENIYSSSGRSNHQMIQSIKTKNQSKTIDIDGISNNDFYKQNQLNNINDSLEISKQIKITSHIRNKLKLPSNSLKSYILETKLTCKNKLLTDIVKNERNYIHKKQIEYDRSLKQEIRNLNKDILKFEQYATNEMLEKNQKYKYIRKIESNKKALLEEIKNLSQEYHSLKANIQKILRYINEKKIFVNFVNKLLGVESTIGNFNLDGINIQKLNDFELHSLIGEVEEEIHKNNIEESIFVTATDEELMELINKIEIVFKISEENILKALSAKEDFRQELILLKKNQNIIKQELESKIEENKKEYQDILKDLEGEQDNAYFKLNSSEDYDDFVRNLLKDFFIFLNNDFLKHKEEIDEYNIIDKIVKPGISHIKNKEKYIDNLIFNMEKFSEEDPEIFNKCINKIKNENKLKKYIREKENKEIELNTNNSKIMDKYNKIFIKERNNFKMLAPLSIFRKSKNKVKELKNETADFKLIYY